MDENIFFVRVFARRSAICFFAVMLLMFTCILRVAVAATGDYAAVLEQQSSLRISVGRRRGTVFDHNMRPITNNRQIIIASVSPTPRAVTGISSLLEGERLEQVLSRLKSGKPVICEVDRRVECDGIAYTTIFENNSSDTPAIHMIGYTNAEGHGISGLEKAYDEILYSKKTTDFVYTTDGLGGVLDGIEPRLEGDTSASGNGVVTTLDINIQAIAEKASEGLNAGAVVVCEAKTGKIRAMVSRPDFDPTNLTQYLDRSDSPLLNRAVSAYNVGSVFKPCVAAAGIEAGKGAFLHKCTGSTKIIDRVFKCHKRSGHGDMDLKSALAFSCNTFFYDFSFFTGGERVYKMASLLGFGQKQNLCRNISTAEGSLPECTSLSNLAVLANFSIGQGELLLSPVSILTLYCAVATDGTYNTPSIVEGTIENGSFKKEDKNAPTRVMKAETAQIIREGLVSVITDGTGGVAAPETTTAGGKTATAQTGKFVGEAEIYQAWFCGFFPAENPEYVVTVFAENNKAQDISCGEIFAKIADEITQFEAVDK